MRGFGADLGCCPVRRGTEHASVLDVQQPPRQWSWLVGSEPCAFSHLLSFFLILIEASKVSSVYSKPERDLEEKLNTTQFP